MKPEKPTDRNWGASGLPRDKDFPRLTKDCKRDILDEVGKKIDISAELWLEIEFAIYVYNASQSIHERSKPSKVRGGLKKVAADARRLHSTLHSLDFNSRFIISDACKKDKEEKIAINKKGSHKSANKYTKDNHLREIDGYSDISELLATIRNIFRIASNNAKKYPKSGRLHSNAATNAIEYLAKAWERLAGEPPRNGRTSKFPILVRAVFEFGIKQPRSDLQALIREALQSPKLLWVDVLQGEEARRAVVSITPKIALIDSAVWARPSRYEPVRVELSDTPPDGQDSPPARS